MDNRSLFGLIKNTQFKEEAYKIFRVHAMSNGLPAIIGDRSLFSISCVGIMVDSLGQENEENEDNHGVPLYIFKYVSYTELVKFDEGKISLKELWNSCSSLPDQLKLVCNNLIEAGGGMNYKYEIGYKKLNKAYIDDDYIDGICDFTLVKDLDEDALSLLKSRRDSE